MGWSAWCRSICCGECNLTVCAKCDSTNLSGASVTVTNGTTTFSGTTGAGGCITFTGFTAGLYTITVSHSSYTTYSANQNLACNETFTVDLCCLLTVGVGVCSTEVPYPGATVVVTSGATIIASGTTDSSGNFTWPSSSVLLPATYTVAVSGAFLFQDFTASVDFFECGLTYSATLVPITGYICPCGEGSVSPCPGSLNPIPPMLTFNDGIGDITLTQGATSWCAAGVGHPTWVGCANRTFTNICIYDSTTSTYSIGSGSFPVWFCFACDGAGGTFEVTAYVLVQSTTALVTPSDCSMTPNTVLFGPISAAAIACYPFDWGGTYTPACTLGVCLPVTACNSGVGGFGACTVYGCGAVDLTVVA